ncbi:hypothetical protein CS0771_05660 [Catellatospora sp. IY07-71]|uniref:CBM96 family carbohydrate-binding protein n=1 Tax=Catellatospora sp. IY07-71 TaxID=2728827 RepID=UPI001BB2F5FB|nr:hypothetical protein [Catellatospora sp. IY07-71]BCJ71022.1 hypothetical protein CS0771_05660 [Catellatospora sp. IY07-71]
MGRSRVGIAVTVTMSTLASAVLLGLLAGRLTPPPARIPVSEDSYTVSTSPGVTAGTQVYLTAGGYDGGAAVSYLKFDVTMPAGKQPRKVWLWLGRHSGTLPGIIELSRVPDTRWHQGTITAGTAPRLGDVVAGATPGRFDRAVAFDVTRVIRRSGRYAFAVTAPFRNEAARFVAAEAHGSTTGAPTITFEWDPPSRPVPPPPADGPSATPSAPPSVRPSTTPWPGSGYEPSEQPWTGTPSPSAPVRPSPYPAGGAGQQTGASPSTSPVTQPSAAPTGAQPGDRPSPYPAGPAPDVPSPVSSAPGPRPGEQPSPSPEPNPFPEEPAPSTEPSPDPLPWEPGPGTEPGPGPIDPSPLPGEPSPDPVDPSPFPGEPSPEPVDPSPFPGQPGTGTSPDPDPSPLPGEPSPDPVDPSPLPGEPGPSPSEPGPSAAPSASASPVAEPSPAPGPPSPSTEPSAEPSPTGDPNAPVDCVIGRTLVPTCGALWGVAPGAHTSQNRIQALHEFERRTNRLQVVYHAYHRGTSLFPTAEELAITRDPAHKRVLFLNWKPQHVSWAGIAAGDRRTDAYLDRLATHIKGSLTDPFFFTMHHEPENDVVPRPGSGMTARDYAAAFRYVVTGLRARGVDNLVSVMCYMAFVPWNVKDWFEELYPGDDVVDWVAWDTYAYSDPGYGYGDFAEMMNRKSGSRKDWPGFYNWAAQSFPDKPLMLGEWGVWHSRSNPQHQARFFDSARLQLELFPRLKALVYFESPSAEEGRSSMIDMTREGLSSFQEFSKHPAFDIVTGTSAGYTR